MPEFPHNSRMLSQVERDLAVWRIESESGAAEGNENESTLSGFYKALKDPKLILLIMCNMWSQGQGSIANYFPTLVSALGYSSTISLLLTAPPYILAGFVYYGIMFWSDRKNTAYPIIMYVFLFGSCWSFSPCVVFCTRQCFSPVSGAGNSSTGHWQWCLMRGVTASCTQNGSSFAVFSYLSFNQQQTQMANTPSRGCIAIASVMYIIPMATENVGARYFSMMILPFASVGPQILMYKTMSLHLARPISKRAAASALVNAIGGTSNIWASYLYYAPPHFFAAMGTLMGCAALFAVTISTYRYLVLRDNKRLDSGDPAEIAKAMKGGVTQEMVDLGWRYEMY